MDRFTNPHALLLTFNFLGNIMKTIHTLALVALTGLTVITAGCAVSRGQETMGAYVDDTGITSLVKSRMFEDKTVSGLAIGVETLNGTVQLTGFAKSYTEKMQAENIARGVNNVKSVRNDIVVRP
jgi:hyperosmotically inducible periplasmic protein